MKILKRRTKGSALVMGVSLMAITACNDVGLVTPVRTSPKNNLEEGQSYTANLEALNTQYGTGNGEATISVENGQVVVEVETSGLKEVAHIQSIREGSCPTAEADANDDGIIDASEAGLTDENLVLALDGDLSTTEAGANEYPISDVTGNYLYSESAESSVVTAQDLTGKIVLIHGIPETEALPQTVKGLGQEDQHETMPVLCGVIEKEQVDEDPQGETPDEGQGGGSEPDPDQGQQDQGQQDQGQQDQGQQQPYPQQQQQQHQQQSEGKLE